jgi:hypothetical protein
VVRVGGDLPALESLPLRRGVRSESQAIDATFLASRLRTYLNDDAAVLTVRGRLRSGEFGFRFGSCRLDVRDVQVEVDAGFEGSQLYLLEAKFGSIDDVIIRQLFYPVRMWQLLVKKPVIPILLIYANKVFSLYKFRIEDPDDYLSISIDGEPYHFSFEQPARVPSIQDALDDTKKLRYSPPAGVPFPQADDSNTEELAERLGFDPRQGGYYSNAASWLGYLVRSDSRSGRFVLTAEGRALLSQSPGERVTSIMLRLLSSRIFRGRLEERVQTGQIDRAELMKELAKWETITGETLRRRAQTVESWVAWMLRVQSTDYGIERQGTS